MQQSPTCSLCGAKHTEDQEHSQGEPCPTCGGPTKVGFGLAGGGYGAYTYCDLCERVAHKWQEPT